MQFFYNEELNKIDKQNWEYYQKVLKKEITNTWDYIVITASNEKQKNEYECQIKKREQEGYLPNKTKFIVITDYKEQRIGSGGATLNVVRYMNLNEQEFKNKKTLMIHSGGNSKRILQYAIIGKLFMPIQRILPDGRPSSLFDEILLSFITIPSKIDNGMVILSGDVWLIFDTSKIDLKKEKVVAISAKTNKEKGINHGVFIVNENKELVSFLHKQSEEVLVNSGAIQNDLVNIDTGVVYFNKNIIDKLLELIMNNNKFDNKYFEKFVNSKAQISLYNDFMYVFSKKSSFTNYLKEKPEGEFCNELTICRKNIWNKFNKYNAKVIETYPSEFIHLGTTKEFIDFLSYNEINRYNIERRISTNVNIKNIQYTVNNSYIDNNAIVNQNAYIENSKIEGNSIIGKSSIISNSVIKNINIPDDVCIITIKLQPQKYVSIIYGIRDNPKNEINENTIFLKQKILNVFKTYNIGEREIYGTQKKDIWNAKIFKVEKDKKNSVKASIDLYNIIQYKKNKKEVEDYFIKKRISMCESISRGVNEKIII